MTVQSKDNRMKIIISAIGSDNVIGTGDGLPWHIPEEYNQFLSFIKDQTVIMGRRSYEIFQKDMLPKRMIVVSGTLRKVGHAVFDSLEKAVEYAESFSEDVYICGGQTIYEEALGFADYMYLSFIKGKHEGNVFFPNFDEANWRVEKKEPHEAFTFVVYRRKREKG